MPGSGFLTGGMIDFSLVGAICAGESYCEKIRQSTSCVKPNEMTRDQINN